MELSPEAAQKSNLFFVSARLFALHLKAGRADQAEDAFWAAASYAWEPDEFYWNEWSALMVKEFCDPSNRSLAILGAKQSGKSTTVMAIAIVLFYGAWKKCSVTYRTTTLDEAEKRGWGEFQRLIECAQNNIGLPGYLMRSKPPKLLTSKGSADKKFIVTCMPVKDRGEKSNKTELAGVKGFHTEFQLVIDDELNELAPGSQNVRAALEASWKFFRYIGIGNPNSWDNPLGELSRPVKIVEELPGQLEDKYEDLPIEELYSKHPITWKIRGGTAIRLDARNSPNILRGQNPDGTWPYKHMPTPSTVRLQLTACGGDPNHVLMWQFIYALPPPDGTKATILSRPMVRQYRGDTRPEWRNSPTYVAGLDPAFTEKGDDCILRFARHGLTYENVWRVEILDRILIKIIAAEEREVFFVIAEQTMKACKERKIDPWNFAFDCSGTGQGLRSVFYREWSPFVHEVDSTGYPTKLIVSANNPKIAKDHYDRRSSEIVYRIRHYIEAGQLCGLDGEASSIIQEGSERQFRSTTGGKTEVLSKDTTYGRQRGRKSSNDLDAVAMICDLLAHQGYTPGVTWNDARTITDQLVDRAMREQMLNADLIDTVSSSKTSATPPSQALTALYNALGRSAAGSSYRGGGGGGLTDDDIGIGGI